MHNTRSSHALLSQMNLLEQDFVDTSFTVKNSSVIGRSSLVSMEIKPDGAHYIALLDASPESRLTSFAEWWDTPVFSDPAGNQMSRKQLVLTCANQDGGAHVDPSLDPIYAKVTKENFLGWVKVDQSGNEESMGDPSKEAIRQIAHETLKTLVDGYEMKPQLSGSVFADIYISNSTPPHIAAIHYQGPNGTTTPDNMLCPCGSGTPYKGCHNKT